MEARKIVSVERDAYRAMYNRDPVGTQMLLSKLEPGLPFPDEDRPSRTGLLPELGN